MPRFKRFFLLTLLALTGLAAVLIAMGVFRAGRSPEVLKLALQTAILGALAHGMLLLVSFAAFTALERPRIRIVALAGMLLAIVMLLMVPVFTWWQITHIAHVAVINRKPELPDSGSMGDLVASGFLSACLLCIIPFILVPRMKRIGRIVQFTAILYLSVAYIALVLWIWHIDTQRIEEMVATLLIPAGACTLGVFALQKFLETHRPDAPVSLPSAMHIRCPRCQKEQTVGLGASRCSCCRLRFNIEVAEPVCPNCQFNLHGLPQPICPECGHSLDEADVAGPLTLPPAADAAS